MRFESAEQALEQLRKLEKEQAAFQHALGVLELDGASAAPTGSWEGRGIVMGVLSEKIYNLISDPQTGELIAYLKARFDELDAKARREVEVVAKSYNQLHRIPAEEYVAYTVLLNDAQAIWEQAKNTDDFSLFQPYLQKSLRCVPV